MIGEKWPKSTFLLNCMGFLQTTRHRETSFFSHEYWRYPNETGLPRDRHSQTVSIRKWLHTLFFDQAIPDE